MRATIRNPVNAVVERAVELSRVSGSPSRESGAGFGGIATNEDLSTTPDENGYTNHQALTELDFTNDLNSFTS